MKLIMTNTNLTLKGGAERVVLKIAQHYDAKVYVAEYDSSKTFEGFKDVDVEVIGKQGLLKALPYGRASQGLNYGLSFYGLRVREDYDVINAHMAPSHWIRKSNERVIWYCHTPLRDVYDLYNYRLSLKKLHQKPVHIIGSKAVKILDQGVVKNIEKIVTNSYNTRSRIIKYYGRHDTTVLGGGVEYENYEKGSDGKYFLYPSRISPNKRQDYAIRAFNHFKRQVKGYKLIIAGAVSEDKFYQNYYKKLVALANGVGYVEIITDASDKRLAHLYSNCTAVLFTPLNEDYGLVPIEGMASYKPVIAVNEGGTRETIEDRKTGILTNSIEEMGNAMKEVAENPSFAAELGRNGRDRVVKHYSWSRFFKKYDKLLNEVKKK
jgi:glycosyltransferase involved in cell wall biosynthesis